MAAAAGAVTLQAALARVTVAAAAVAAAAAELAPWTAWQLAPQACFERQARCAAQCAASSRSVVPPLRHCCGLMVARRLQLAGYCACGDFCLDKRNVIEKLADLPANQRHP